MNRVGLAAFVTAVVVMGSTCASSASASITGTVCSPRSSLDDSEIVVTWTGETSRPIHWGRAVLRIDVQLTSRSTGAMLCDPDAWIEIHQLDPVRRSIDSGPVVIVDSGDGRRLHRFDWRIRGRVAEAGASRYEIVFFTGRAPAIEIGADDRFAAGFVPITSSRVVAKWASPDKGRIQEIQRS